MVSKFNIYETGGKGYYSKINRTVILRIGSLTAVSFLNPIPSAFVPFSTVLYYVGELLDDNGASHFGRIEIPGGSTANPSINVQPNYPKIIGTYIWISK